MIRKYTEVTYQWGSSSGNAWHFKFVSLLSTYLLVRHSAGEDFKSHFKLGQSWFKVSITFLDRRIDRSDLYYPISNILKTFTRFRIQVIAIKKKLQHWQESGPADDIDWLSVYHPEDS